MTILTEKFGVRFMPCHDLFDGARECGMFREASWAAFNMKVILVRRCDTDWWLATLFVWNFMLWTWSEMIVIHWWQFPDILVELRWHFFHSTSLDVAFFHSLKTSLTVDDLRPTERRTQWVEDFLLKLKARHSPIRIMVLSQSSCDPIEWMFNRTVSSGHCQF